MTMSGALLKLQPNQDVTTALEEAARAAGFARAWIGVAVGSLVEGVVRCGTRVEVVGGPAIEVAALSGEIDPRGATSRLTAYLCREDTSVVAGELVRGRNAVGVTFEIWLCPIP